MVLTNNIARSARAKHLTATAKKRHSNEFIHDAIGSKYRLLNLNAALRDAQIEGLGAFISAKCLQVGECDE